jgi:hypothetical protein
MFIIHGDIIHVEIKSHEFSSFDRQFASLSLWDDHQVEHRSHLLQKENNRNKYFSNNKETNTNFER